MGRGGPELRQNRMRGMFGRHIQRARFRVHSLRSPLRSERATYNVSSVPGGPGTYARPAKVS
eukprot:SAG11_NODE_18988_length_476_cov_1.411141_1_plen_61_part_10